jgi:hypothetical protein
MAIAIVERDAVLLDVFLVDAEIRLHVWNSEVDQQADVVLRRTQTSHPE